MQRSTVLWISRSRLLACLALAMCFAGASAHAAQPITVTAVALQHSASDPNGTTFVPVKTPLRVGATFFYQFDILPKNDPNTPITLNATFDPRLELMIVGSDGSCVGLYDNVHTLACRDQFIDSWQPHYPRMTKVWVWFRVKHSNNPAPIIMTVTTPNDSKTITLAYVPGRMYFPIIRR